MLLEGAFGATIGKLVLGIRVRALDGTRIGFGAAAIRNLARVVDGFPYLIPYLVGAIAVSRSETDQRLGDRWAKTVVVLVGTESKAAHRRPRCRPRPTRSGCRRRRPARRRPSSRAPRCRLRLRSYQRGSRESRAWRAVHSVPTP